MQTRYLALLSLGLAAAGPTLGADVRFDSHVGITSLYSDNYRLATNSAAKESVTSGVLDLSGSLVSRTQTSSLLLVPRFRFSRTSPDVGQNANDRFLTLNMQHTGLTSNASLTAKYSHQTLSRLYLPNGVVNFDLGAISNTQFLRSLVSRNSQDLLEVSPSASWKLSERAQLQVGGYFTDSSYNLRTADYRDYRNAYGYVGLGLNVSRQDTLGITVHSSQFRPAGSSSTNTQGVNAEWGRRISEVSRYYFRVGNERTRFAGPIPAGGSSSASTVSGGAGVSWVYQVTGLFIDATRSVYPNAIGTPLAQTELRVRIQHLYSPRTSGWISLHGLQTDRLGATTNADGSRFIVANFGLEWRFAQTWSLMPAANLVQQRLNANSSNARSNEVILNLVYEPGRKAQGAAVRVQ